MTVQPAKASSRCQAVLWFGMRVFWTLLVVGVYVIAILIRAWWLLILGLPGLVANIYIWRAVLTRRLRLRV